MGEDGGDAFNYKVEGGIISLLLLNKIKIWLFLKVLKASIAYQSKTKQGDCTSLLKWDACQHSWEANHIEMHELFRYYFCQLHELVTSKVRNEKKNHTFDSYDFAFEFIGILEIM